ncbi:hypothetical protein JXO52_15710 [bacterium]|nr:hypothetical protein [bacterium]
MESVLIVATVMVAFVALVKILSDNRIRRRLIDAGLVDEKIQFLYADRIDARVPSALKWGIVCIAVGAAFLVGQLAPEVMRGEITAGLIFLLAGAGLLGYYAIARTMGEKKD